MCQAPYQEPWACGGENGGFALQGGSGDWTLYIELRDTSGPLLGFWVIQAPLGCSGAGHVTE